MKRFITIIIGIFLLTQTYANENNIHKHSLSVDLGGNVAYCTFKYQYDVYSSENHRIGISAGVAYTGYIMGFPVGIQYSYGKKNRVFVTVNYDPLLISDIEDHYDSDYIWRHPLAPQLGYKRIFTIAQQDIFAQVYYSPLIFFDYPAFISWYGIGIGIYL